MSVLVTGGAGYIGSHMTYALIDRGEAVVVLDNLSTGVRGLVSEKANFVQGEAGDAEFVRRTISEHDIDAVIHFAGSIVVPESVSDPLKYYANNTMVSRALAEACVATGVRHFIFSSTAAVYGVGDGQLATEDSPKAPINPYGRSKLMTEWMLEDAAKAHDFRFMALRYFNVAGADSKRRTGQSTPRATHLIKRACQVALKRVPSSTSSARIIRRPTERVFAISFMSRISSPRISWPSMPCAETRSRRSTIAAMARASACARS